MPRPLVQAQEAAALGQSTEEHLPEVRINAQVELTEPGEPQALYTLSQHASLVFAPFSIHGGRFYDGHGSEIDARLKQLPVTVPVLAAQDVALESDPDQPAEGEQPAPPHNAGTAARDTRQTEE